jgi:hypothetical protein
VRISRQHRAPLPQVFPTSHCRRQAAPSSAAWSRSIAGLLRCWPDPHLGRKLARGTAHRCKASSKLRRRCQPTLGCLHHQRSVRCLRLVVPMSYEETTSKSEHPRPRTRAPLSSPMASGRGCMKQAIAVEKKDQLPLDLD